ncbi:MAG: HupE/UreJ family protein [Motiliproteus sp.]
MLTRSVTEAGSVKRNGLGRVLLSLLLMAIFPGQVLAHFSHFEPRIIHVSQQQDGVQLLLRMPLPLLLLDESWKGGGLDQDVQFSRKARLGEEWGYSVNPADFEQKFDDLEKLVLKTHSLKKDGLLVERLSVTHAHIFNSDKRAPFSTLASAEASFRGGKVKVDEEAIDLFDSAIDIRMFIPDTQLSGSFSIDSDLGVHLKAIERLANIVQIHDGNGKSNTFSSVGALHTRFDPGFDVVGSLISQVKSGILHILKGLDHVLFVLLIAVASSHWLPILKRATVFTAGHSVTLCLGLLGYVPQGAWFIPLVETLIALTIVYAGITIVMKRQEFFGFTAILFVGLIHGFGFSFILDELVSESGGLSVPSLITFNLGIEIGQLAIYATLLPLLYIYQRTSVLQRWNLPAFLSAGAILISASWVYERGALLLAEFQYI